MYVVLSAFYGKNKPAEKNTDQEAAKLMLTQN
jgi:hypothetical protein